MPPERKRPRPAAAATEPAEQPWTSEDEREPALSDTDAAPLGDADSSDAEVEAEVMAKVARNRWRPEGAVKEDMRPGDWICQHCNNHNWAKPGANGRICNWRACPSRPIKRGDWFCPNCGNHNWNFRVACNSCSTRKP